QVMHHPAGPCIPDLHGGIVAGRREVLPVGAISHAITSAGMPAEGQDLVAGACVPNPHCLISPGRSEALTIRAKRHTPNLGLVFSQGVKRRIVATRSLTLEVPD